MRRVCVLLAAAAVLVAAASSNLRADRPAAQSSPATRPAAPPAPVAQAATTSLNQRELVQKYCVTCHNERAKTGGLVLENLDPQNTATNPELWEKVVLKLRGGMMPPQGMPRPDAD